MIGAHHFKHFPGEKTATRLGVYSRRFRRGACLQGDKHISSRDGRKLGRWHRTEYEVSQLLPKTVSNEEPGQLAERTDLPRCLVLLAFLGIQGDVLVPWQTQEELLADNAKRTAPP